MELDISLFEKNTKFYGELDILLTIKSFDLQAIRKRYIDSKSNPNKNVGSFQRRKTTEGGVVHLKISEGTIKVERLLTKMLEPRGIDFHEGKIALSSENKIFILSEKKVYTIENDWFSYIHTVKFNKNGTRIVVSSSGLDCLFEYDWKTGKMIREWFAWDNGLNKAKSSEEGGVVLTRKPEDVPSLQQENDNVLLINKPKEQFLPTAKRAAFINSVTYDFDDNNYVLATLFHEGSVRKINLGDGSHEIIWKGLNCPHGGTTMSQGKFMVTNTRGGRVEYQNASEKRLFEFKNLQGKPEELGEMEWLQNSVDFGDYIVTIDSNRNKLVIFDPENQKIDSIGYDLNWAVQDLIPIDSSQIDLSIVSELSSND